jgi:hypothetical protein
MFYRTDTPSCWWSPRAVRPPRRRVPGRVPQGPKQLELRIPQHSMRPFEGILHILGGVRSLPRGVDVHPTARAGRQRYVTTGECRFEGILKVGIAAPHHTLPYRGLGHHLQTIGVPKQGRVLCLSRRLTADTLSPLPRRRLRVQLCTCVLTPCRNQETSAQVGGYGRFECRRRAVGRLQPVRGLPPAKTEPT